LNARRCWPPAASCLGLLQDPAWCHPALLLLLLLFLLCLFVCWGLVLHQPPQPALAVEGQRPGCHWHYRLLLPLVFLLLV
jgi:hypothetical protein